MKYIDTNIIVRLITNDVPKLANQAVNTIEKSDLLSIALLDSVITEVCFVLEFNPSYKLPRSVIYDGLYALIDSGKFITGQFTHEALDIYTANKELDYVDCLLLASAKGKRSNLMTFDKALLGRAN